MSVMSSPRSRGFWWRWLRRPTRTSTGRTMLAVVLAAAIVIVGAGPVGADESTEDRLRSSPGEAADYSITAKDVDLSALVEASAPAAAPVPTLGDGIAGFALAYQGYPYVAAGNTPAGFDCSGFTQFVILNVVGYDIGHAVEGQPGSGAWVDWGAWLPGDLIFFQNTYRAGISHVGIYIGDGLFIHAENEGTGVVITSLYSGYYSARYWGATRVA